MITYIIRRVAYAVPIIVGVCFITFTLFFLIQSPDQVARHNLGKDPSPAQITAWKQQHGYDRPLPQQFLHFTVDLLTFHFGKSDVSGEPVADKLRSGMGPSLMLAVPSFIISLVVTICLSLIVAYFRGTYLDLWAVFVCVLLMSISALLYIIGGQWLLAIQLKLMPVMGFNQGVQGWKFIVAPLVIGVISGLGGGIRFYRTIMVEEMGQDYVRTARAKGVSEAGVLFKHILKNSMIPILTSAVMTIPFLFLGSLIMEPFFGIPGLGLMMKDAIDSADFGVIRPLVFIGALLYIVGALLTDISYTLVDPRVRFGD